MQKNILIKTVAVVGLLVVLGLMLWQGGLHVWGWVGLVLAAVFGWLLGAPFGNSASAVQAKPEDDLHQVLNRGGDFIAHCADEVSAQFAEIKTEIERAQHIFSDAITG